MTKFINWWFDDFILRSNLHFFGSAVLVALVIAVGLLTMVRDPH